MDKINLASKRALVYLGLDDAAHAAFVCFEAGKILKKLFEKDFTKEIKIVSFKNGYLYVQTLSSTYSQEIKIKESEIGDLLFNKIQEKLKGVRFKCRE